MSIPMIVPGGKQPLITNNLNYRNQVTINRQSTQIGRPIQSLVNTPEVPNTPEVINDNVLNAEQIPEVTNDNLLNTETSGLMVNTPNVPEVTNDNLLNTQQTPNVNMLKPTIKLSLKNFNSVNVNNGNASVSTLPPNSKVTTTYSGRQMRTKTLNNDENTAFEYVFSDHQADTLKSTVDYLNKFKVPAYVYCSSDEIRFVVCDSTKNEEDSNVTNIATFSTDKLYSASYNSNEEVFIYLANLEYIKKALKNVAKASSLIMYRTPSDSCIYWEIINSQGAVNESSTVEFIIPSPLTSIVDYHTPVYTGPPNVKMVTCGVFKQAGDTTFDDLKLECYSNALIICGGLADKNDDNKTGMSGSYYSCGKVTHAEKVNGCIDEKIVPRAFIKHFNGIHKLSIGSHTRLWFSSEGKSIKIEKAIGHIGTLEVYVRGKTLPSASV